MAPPSRPPTAPAEPPPTPTPRPPAARPSRAEPPETPSGPTAERRPSPAPTAARAPAPTEASVRESTDRPEPTRRGSPTPSRAADAAAVAAEPTGPLRRDAAVADELRPDRPSRLGRGRGDRQRRPSRRAAAATRRPRPHEPRPADAAKARADRADADAGRDARRRRRHRAAARGRAARRPTAASRTSRRRAAEPPTDVRAAPRRLARGRGRRPTAEPDAPATPEPTAGESARGRAAPAGQAAPQAPAGPGRRRRPPRPARAAPAPAQGPAAAPPRPHPADAAARPARLRDRQRGRRQRLLGQPGRPRGVPRLRRHPPRHDLDRPAAPGPARRAGQDRAAEHRRRPLPARRQPEAAQGVARGGHLELRQLRRRRPEHGERPAAAARLGPEPAHRPAGRRVPQGEGAVHRTASSCMRGRGGRPGHVHPGGRLPQDPRGRPTRSTGPGSTPRATRSPTQAAGEARASPPRSSRDKEQLPELHAKLERGRPRRRWPASWRSASRPCTTSSRPWPGPTATRATTCPSRSSRRASSSSKTSPPAWS